jgi:hypothetical protein
MHTKRRSPYINVAVMSAALLGCGLVSAAAPASAPAPVPQTPGAPGAPPPATAQCKEAVVSPVSGFAECVDPRGAPVAPPPKRPDPPASGER